MTVGPEILEYSVCDHSERIQRNKIYKGKGQNDVVTEIIKSEDMFVEKHQCKTNKTKLNKIKENGKHGPCSWYLAQIGNLEEYGPCGYDQRQHDNVLPCKTKIRPVYKIGEKISQEV